jgi:hypothetical protein
LCEALISWRYIKSLNALAMLFLNLRGGGFDVAGIFWGLWLFLQRFLGVVLVVSGFAYLANSFTSLLLARYEAVGDRWMSPLEFGEVVFRFWLLIRGAKPPTTLPVPRHSRPESRAKRDDTRPSFLIRRRSSFSIHFPFWIQALSRWRGGRYRVGEVSRTWS